MGQGFYLSPGPLSYYERLDCNGFLDELVLVLEVLLLCFLELLGVLVLDSEHCQLQLMNLVSDRLPELFPGKSVLAVCRIDVLDFPFRYHFLDEVGFDLFLGLIDQFLFLGLLDLLLFGRFRSFLFFSLGLQSFFGFLDLLGLFFDKVVDSLYQVGLFGFLSLIFLVLFHG